MSGINTNFYGYMNGSNVSSLFGGASSSSSSSIAQMLGGSSSGTSSSYGVNTSTASSSTLNYVQRLKTGSSSLDEAFDKLIPKSKQSGAGFTSYAATSSNKEVLTASSIDSKGKTDENLDSIGVRVEQLATKQKNEGEALSVTNNDFGVDKYYEFQVEIDGKKTNFSFATDKSSNNRSVQQTMADEINKKNIGVNASVEYDSKTKTSKLTLQSTKTGVDADEDRAFTVRDIKGGAAALTGANNMKQEAKNAVYYVGTIDKEQSKDGNIVLKGDVQQKTSKSNDVEINSKVKASFLKTSEEFVSIDKKPDYSKAIDSVRSMVNGFNELFDASKANGTTGSNRLNKELSGLAGTYSKALGEIGISADADGYLKIDETKMKTASENGKLKSFFEDDAGSNYGFANRLEQTANKVENSPYQYVENGKDNSNSSSRTWEDRGVAEENKNYSLMFRLQKYENVGFLFNSMF